MPWIVSKLSWIHKKTLFHLVMTCKKKKVFIIDFDQFCVHYTRGKAYSIHFNFISHDTLHKIVKNVS